MHRDRIYTVKIRPCRQEFPLLVVDLDAVVFPVRHIKSSLRVECQCVRSMEFIRTSTAFAPSEEKFSLAIVFYNPGIAITVGHKNLSSWCHKHSRRLVKMTRIIAMVVSSTKSHQQLALAAELHNNMSANVRNPHIVPGIHMKAMNPRTAFHGLWHRTREIVIDGGNNL